MDKKNQVEKTKNPDRKFRQIQADEKNSVKKNNEKKSDDDICKLI